MASTSFIPCRWKHDVFISFSGADIRNGFLSYLSDALCEVPINVFTVENLLTGEEIVPALSRAIEQSRVLIVVFSKYYLSSAWCLDELVKIMDCKKRMGQIVLQVFYQIDRSDVHKLTETDAFAALARRFEDKVQNWNLALKETAKLSGIYPSQNLEGMVFLRNLVIDNLNRLALTDTERPSPYDLSQSNLHCVRNHAIDGLHRLTITATERPFLYNQSQSDVHCLRNQVIDGLHRLTITDTERPLRYDQSQPVLAHTLPTPPSYVVVSPSNKPILLLTLEAEKATKEKYCEFVEALRTRLASGDKRPDGKRVMCDVSAFCNQEQRILLVSISSSDTTSATLVIDRSDAYIVGYRVQNQTYLLDLGGEKEWFYDVFQDSKRLHLKFGYDDLEKKAEQSISEIQLGINQLKSAVARLNGTSHEDVDCKIKIVAKSLMICIQMISEAGRFYDMEKKVCESITDRGYKSFKVDNTMLKRQKNWESVSSVIQNSYPHLALLKFKGQVDDHGAGASGDHSAEGERTWTSSKQSAKGKVIMISGRENAKGKGKKH